MFKPITLGLLKRAWCDKLLGMATPRAYEYHINIRDPTKHDFWYPAHIGPLNQNVRCVCMFMSSSGPLNNALWTDVRSLVHSWPHRVRVIPLSLAAKVSMLAGALP